MTGWSDVIGIGLLVGLPVAGVAIFKAIDAFRTLRNRVDYIDARLSYIDARLSSKRDRGYPPIPGPLPPPPRKRKKGAA